MSRLGSLRENQRVAMEVQQAARDKAIHRAKELTVTSVADRLVAFLKVIEDTPADDFLEQSYHLANKGRFSKPKNPQFPDLIDLNDKEGVKLTFFGLPEKGYSFNAGSEQALIKMLSDKILALLQNEWIA